MRFPFFRKPKERRARAPEPIEHSTALYLDPIYLDFEYRVGNLQGVGTRRAQEDSFAVANVFDEEKIREEGLFFMVCDGMGGMKDGALASQTAIGHIRNGFFDMDREGDLAAQLRDCVFAASAEVEAVIGGDGGSTAVGGIIYNDKFYYASVGDSSLFLLRSGSLYRLNREQNLCHEKYLDRIREGNMVPGDLQDDREAPALTAFLGMEGLSDIDCSVRPLPIERGDVLMACSDGVAGVLSEAEITEALRMDSVQEACAWMEQRIQAYARINQDNYTAVVVKCS